MATIGSRYSKIQRAIKQLICYEGPESFKWICSFMWLQWHDFLWFSWIKRFAFNFCLKWYQSNRNTCTTTQEGTVPTKRVKELLSRLLSKGKNVYKELAKLGKIISAINMNCQYTYNCDTNPDFLSFCILEYRNFQLIIVD